MAHPTPILILKTDDDLSHGVKMNSKEGQNALEIMLMQSLVSKLNALGANPELTQQTIDNLDFNDIRAHLTRTDADLQAHFSSLFS